VKNTLNKDFRRRALKTKISGEEYSKRRLQRRILQRLQLSSACLIPKSAHRFCDHR